MRFIPTGVHGLLDYTLGVALIALPWVGRFAAGGAETWVPVAVGVMVIGAALMTDFEWGAVGAIPMPTHLLLDLLTGGLLAASPWLFGFADRVWAPHLVFGLMEIGAALTTQTVPGVVGRRRMSAGRGMA